MTTLIMTDPRMVRHDPGPGHPERPERMEHLLSRLDERAIEGRQRRSPRPATDSELEAVHATPYLHMLRGLKGKSHQLDADTAVSPDSYDTALLAAGAAIESVVEVWGGRSDNAFALVRPPGHHAESDEAMGFCLLNNVAIAAAAALRQGAQRVLIVDWDVHHGNGTQHIFEARRDILYFSLHQFPIYPGTGAADEVGWGEGAGFTVNCPLPGGQSDADYGGVFSQLLAPIARKYIPDIVLVSAGFDAHRADPLGGMRLTDRGFAAMCSSVKSLADELCGGKLVLVLEGGYDLEALTSSVEACLEVLQGRREEFPDGVGSAAADSIRTTQRSVRRFWAPQRLDQ